LKATTNSFSGGLYYAAGTAVVLALAIRVVRTAARAPRAAEVRQ
jgi:hypothetical protein